MRRGRHEVRSSLVAAIVVVALAGCTPPGPGPAPSPTDTTTDTATDEAPVADLDAEEEALAAEVESLRVTIVALRRAIDDAAAGDRAALEEAGRLLAAELETVLDPSLARAAADATDAPVEPPTERDGPSPLLPGPVVSRATTVSYGDLLTTTLAAARSAGSAGEPVIRFLEVPVAGALGTWQRAAGDQLAAIGEAGAVEDVDEATEAILGLTGEAPRALAWVVHGLRTDTPTAEAALRASAHLAVIETALEELA